MCTRATAAQIIWRPILCSYYAPCLCAAHPLIDGHIYTHETFTTKRFSFLAKQQLLSLGSFIFISIFVHLAQNRKGTEGILRHTQHGMALLGVWGDDILFGVLWAWPIKRMSQFGFPLYLGFPDPLPVNLSLLMRRYCLVSFQLGQMQGWASNSNIPQKGFLIHLLMRRCSLVSFQLGQMQGWANLVIPQICQGRCISPWIAKCKLPLPFLLLCHQHNFTFSEVT